MTVTRRSVLADVQRGLDSVAAGELLLSRDGGERLVSIVDGLAVDLVEFLEGLQPVLDDVPMDEKEGYVRLHVLSCRDFDVRLHVWLPVRDEEYVENVHDHRRYMISRILHGSYRSREFDLDPHDRGAVKLNRIDTVKKDNTRLIGPYTIHAIGNPFERHCVSLIVRGRAVTPVLHTFDRIRGTVGTYASQKPVTWTGRSPADAHLTPAEYKAHLLARLRAEASQP
jgi:hypothetical protein